MYRNHTPLLRRAIIVDWKADVVPFEMYLSHFVFQLKVANTSESEQAGPRRSRFDSPFV